MREGESPLSKLSPDPDPLRTAKSYDRVVTHQQQRMPAFRQRMLEAAQRAEEVRDRVVLLLSR